MPGNSLMFWKVRATRALGDAETLHPLKQEVAVPGGQRQPSDGRLVEAGEAVEQCRLAGAVGADDAGDLGRAGGEGDVVDGQQAAEARSEEHTSELQSLMRISSAVFCLKKKKSYTTTKQ